MGTAKPSYEVWCQQQTNAAARGQYENEKNEDSVDKERGQVESDTCRTHDLVDHHHHHRKRERVRLRFRNFALSPRLSPVALICWLVTTPIKYPGPPPPPLRLHIYWLAEDNGEDMLSNRTCHHTTRHMPCALAACAQLADHIPSWWVVGV